MQAKYTEDILENAKEEIRSILIKIARNQARISYSELCNLVKTVKLFPDTAILATLLGQISQEDDAQ